MRVDSTPYYVLKDHLGSASVITDSSGSTVGEQRYYPFGETRVTTGSIPTDKLFTGQREMAGLGIYHYGARFYSPKLGRFLSPDGIIPSYTDPQDLNRFSYVSNNPLRYTDPDGHRPVENDGGGGKRGCGSACVRQERREAIAAQRAKRNEDAPKLIPVHIPTSTIPKSVTVPINSGSNPYINVQVSTYKLPTGFTPVSGGPLALINVPTSGGIGLQIYNPAPQLDKILLAKSKGKDKKGDDWNAKKPKDGTVKNPDGTTTISKVRNSPGNDGGWSRIIVVRDANGKVIEVIHEAWKGTSDPRVDPPDHRHPKNLG